MKDLLSPKPSFKKSGAPARQVVDTTPAALVKTSLLPTGESLPLVIEPAGAGVGLESWAVSAPEFLQTNLAKHGALLLRGFGVASVGEFEQFIRAIAGELLEYTYRSTPRSQVGGKIYTSTEYPADQSIPMHNEVSYSTNWPLKLWFHCVQPASTRGETPIADSRRVLQRMPAAIRERFIEKKVMYVRNFGEGLGLTWQNVFQTEDRAELETYCRSAGIHCEWRDGSRLRTRQVCQSVARHPRTGEMVWFNQANLFHIASLPAATRATLLATFAVEDLPRHACYGDGTPIEDSVIGEIEEVYRQESVLFPWLAGDVLMMDNMLAAHGRSPFTGSRKVVVGMAEAYSVPVN